MIHALFALLVLLQPSYGTKGPREPSWEPVYLGDMVMGGKMERGALSIGTTRNFAGYNVGRHLSLPEWLYLEAGAYSWFPGGLLVCCFVIPDPISLILHFIPTPYVKASLDLGEYVRVGGYWSWRMDEAVFLQIKVGRWLGWFHARHSLWPSYAAWSLILNNWENNTEHILSDLPFSLKKDHIYPVQVIEGGLMYAISPTEGRALWLRARGVFLGYDNDWYNLRDAGDGYLMDEGQGNSWDLQYALVNAGYSFIVGGWKIDLSVTPIVVGRDEEGFHLLSRGKWYTRIIPFTTSIIDVSGTYYF